MALLEGRQKTGEQYSGALACSPLLSSGYPGLEALLRMKPASPGTNVGKFPCGHFTPVNLNKSQGHQSHWLEGVRGLGLQVQGGHHGNSVGIRPGHSTLLSWSPWSVPLPGVPGSTWALEQQGPRRCKACLGGKHSEPLTQNNSFIQKLLVYEFPASLSQVEKPSLMGTTQPPQGKQSWWAGRTGSNGDPTAPRPCSAS